MDSIIKGAPVAVSAMAALSIYQIMHKRYSTPPIETYLTSIVSCMTAYYGSVLLFGRHYGWAGPVGLLLHLYLSD